MQPQQDAFQDPKAMGEPGPAMSELAGRTVAVVVKTYDPTATYQAPGDKDGPKSRPSVYGDLFVFDGGPLNYGGSDSSTDPKPPTHTIQTPCVFRGRYFAGVNVVSALRDAAPVIVDANGAQTKGPGNGGPVIGLVERSTFGGKPWNLTKLDPSNAERGPQFAHLRQQAGQIWGAMAAGSLVMADHATNGIPIPGVAAPVPGANPYAQQAPQAGYGAPQAQVNQWAGGPVNPQAPQQQPWGQGAPQAPQFAPPVPQAPPVDPQYAAWLASQGQGPAVTGAPYVPTQGAAPVVEQVQQIPPQYAAIWGTLTDDQRAAILAQLNPQAAPQAGPRTNPY